MPRLLTLSLALLTLAACSSEAADSEVTYAEHVAPLVYRSCTPCHRERGPGPFALQSYEDVFEHRAQIVEVTADRWMPPWLPTHGEFVDDRRLTEEEIATLAAWSRHGERGDPSKEPPCPEFGAGWQLGEPDLVVEFPELVTVAADGPERFRNFAARRRRRDREDEEPGFEGMDMAGATPPDGYFLGWTPGRTPRELPEGMGFALPAGGDLVLQLHLTPIGKPESFRPRVGFYFRDTQPSAISFPLTLFADEIDLPAGADDVVIRDHLVVPVPVRICSVYPHAHYLCANMRGWATLPHGQRVELFEIPRWDFDWQDDYLYVEPVSLPAGAKIEFSYRYDNSANNPDNPSSPPVRVREGDRSVDEMANLTLQVLLENPDARRELGAAAARRALQKRPEDVDKRVELAVILREQGRIDDALTEVQKVLQARPTLPKALCEASTCQLQRGNAEEALLLLDRCIEHHPEQHQAHAQRGVLLLRAGRAAEAADALEEAVRLRPQLASLHTNLATAFLAGNELGRAEQHYRLALERNQGVFQAWFNLGRILAATNRRDDARAALLRAQQLRPADARVAEALRQLSR